MKKLLTSKNFTKSVEDSNIKYKCPLDFCTSEFIHPANISKHLKIHGLNYSKKCNYKGCGMIFCTKAHLKAHLCVHNKQKCFFCPLCFIPISNSNSINEKYSHICEEISFKCPILNCAEEFARKYLFELHLRSHNSSFHACMEPNCTEIIVDISKIFPLKKVIHSCQICQKTFTRNSSIKRHILIHTNEKPFLCLMEGCNYRSNQKSNLDKHITLMHSQKSFKFEDPQKPTQSAFKREKIFLITKVNAKEDNDFKGLKNIFDFSIYFHMINARIKELI